jgi:hypothetical protein
MISIRRSRGFGVGSALLLGLVPLQTGCATLRPHDFSTTPTHFELDRYFVGHARSWGVFENTRGQPQLHFTCDSYGKRDDHGDVALHQQFRFSDGKTPTRDWRIHRIDATHWEATANDMIGVARGEGDGNAFYWEYTITLDRSDPFATVHIRQWIYEPEGTDVLMTRLVISKLGVTVSEVSEVIHHVATDPSLGLRK